MAAFVDHFRQRRRCAGDGDGYLQRPAQESDATWVAPTQPNVRDGIGIADLAMQ